MSVVLLELADTSKTTQGTRRFVSVQNTKVCNPQRKLPVTTFPVSEEYKMSWAIHGLQCPLLLLKIKSEHIVFVVGPVSRRLPDLRIKHVRRLDLLVTTLSVLRSKERLESIEDSGSVWQ